MTYEVLITRSVLKSMSRFPKKVQMNIFAALEGLKTQPRPLGVKKLQGAENAYRIRVGDYRVIYDIHDQKLRVTVITAGHRQNVYQV